MEWSTSSERWGSHHYPQVYSQQHHMPMKPSELFATPYCDSSTQTHSRFNLQRLVHHNETVDKRMCNSQWTCWSWQCLLLSWLHRMLDFYVWNQYQSWHHALYSATVRLCNDKSETGSKESSLQHHDCQSTIINVLPCCYWKVHNGVMIQHFFIDSTFTCRRHHFLVCSDEMMVMASGAARGQITTSNKSGSYCLCSIVMCGWYEDYQKISSSEIMHVTTAAVEEKSGCHDVDDEHAVEDSRHCSSCPEKSLLVSFFLMMMAARQTTTNNISNTDTGLLCHGD